MARWLRLLAAAAWFALAGGAPAQAAVPAAPSPQLVELVETFVALCLEGRPSPDKSARRALAAGWEEVRNPAVSVPVLPAGERLAVMTRRGMIFVLMPPMRDGAERVCEVGANLAELLPLDDLAAPLGARLGLGRHSPEAFGSGISAFWRPSPGLTLIASVPPPGGGRTHIFMAKQAVDAGGR